MEKMEKVKDLKFIDKKLGNVFVCNSGIIKAESLESFGPAIKPYYQMYYIFKGHGLFTIGGKKYKLGKGDGFLISPDELAYFHADKNDPWTYGYVGFAGSDSDELVKGLGLTVKKPLFKSKRNDEIHRTLTEIMANNTYKLTAELKRNGHFNILIAILAENTATSPKGKVNRTDNYVSKAIDFIHANFCDPIKITDVADYVQINRSYLYTLFMEAIEVSPHQFLADYRIEKACILLAKTKASIESVALSCGYMDALVFTKAFKQVKGVSPSQFRKGNVK
ncbi:MAG: AraC family transcriptional regulator [Lachnospiraceae bacterium]|nr:AraC family transcriptional regulator [Lachnospiraceae bacterium]